MIVELDKEYICQEKEIQIQVGGSGTVVFYASQDGLDFAPVKTLTGGEMPQTFNLKHCKIKFESDDTVQVSIVPSDFVISPVDE
jgi:hypothetical protein